MIQYELSDSAWHDPRSVVKGQQEGQLSASRKPGQQLTNNSEAWHTRQDARKLPSDNKSKSCRSFAFYAGFRSGSFFLGESR